jgi:YcxB-like protein
MQITYELNEKDIKAFQYYALKKNSTVKKTNLFNYLFIFVISYWQLFYLVFFKDFLSSFNWTQFLLYFVIGTITFGFVLLFSKAVSYFLRQFVINSTVKKYKNGDGVLGEHLICFKDDFLLEVTDVNETQHSWKGVDRIEEDKDYIFIFTSPLNAHIIPKRYFSNIEASLMFFNEAQRLKELAKTHFSPSYLASNS